MILTKCPYCEETQIFDWECGDPNGYFPSKCHDCGKVMWVEATSAGGATMSHEDFKKYIMEDGDEEEIENAAKIAVNQSCVVYET